MVLEKLVGKGAPLVVNEAGARQSAIPFQLNAAFPWLGAIAVSRVIGEGLEKYGKDNWRGIPNDDHVHKALIHLVSYYSGDRSDDHIEHAACRLLMALDAMANPARNRQLFDSRPGDPPLAP